MMQDSDWQMDDDACQGWEDWVNARDKDALYDDMLNLHMLAEEEHQKAEKFLVNGRTPMNYAPMEILEVFSKMCMAGINKGYEPHSWLTNVSISQHLDALKRHIRDYEKGIDIDKDGFKNLEAILWRSAAACMVDKFGVNTKNNDRWLADILKSQKK